MLGSARSRIALIASLLVMSFGEGHVTAQGAPPPAIEAARSLAPSGRLRVAINLGNTVLARRDAATGELGGVSVALAKALGAKLGVPVDLVAYPAAGEVFAALDRHAWDVAFLANEPERATKIAFSSPYVVIEGTYLVRRDAPFRNVADLDRPGVRIAIGRGAAYDLFLTRTLRNATLERLATSAAAIAAFEAGGREAAAGIRQALVQAAAGRSDLRVLPDSFKRIEQAIAIPRGNAPGAAFIEAFLAGMKASDAIGAALAANGQDAALATAPAP